MPDKNEPLLSSDELSAIQDMVSSGEFDEEPYNTGLAAEPYSISRNEETLGVSYGALTQINERFHRFFRTRLLTELDYNPRLSVATPQLMKYSDYIKNTASPASINVTEYCSFSNAEQTGDSTSDDRRGNASTNSWL